MAEVEDKIPAHLAAMIDKQAGKVSSGAKEKPKPAPRPGLPSAKVGDGPALGDKDPRIDAERQSREDQARAAFERMVGDDEDEDDEQPESAADEAEDEGDEDDQEGREAQLRKARQTLKRLKVPQSVIDATADDALLAWAADASPVVATHDRTFQELQRAKRESQKGTKAEPAGQPAAKPVVNLAEALKPLEGELGTDGAKAVRTAIEAVQAAYEAKLQEATADLALVRADQNRILIADQHARLLELYGSDLGDDPDVWEQVVEEAKYLAQTGRFGPDTIDDCWDKAALLALGHGPQASAPEDSAKAKPKSKRHSALSRGIAPSARTRPRSPEDRAWAAFRTLERTGSVDKARSAGGW